MAQTLNIDGQSSATTATKNSNSTNSPNKTGAAKNEIVKPHPRPPVNQQYPKSPQQDSDHGHLEKEIETLELITIVKKTK